MENIKNPIRLPIKLILFGVTKNYTPPNSRKSRVKKKPFLFDFIPQNHAIPYFSIFTAMTGLLFQGPYNILLCIYLSNHHQTLRRVLKKDFALFFI